MSDMVEKIYCCDKGSNNDALYALLANQRNDNSPFMASMMNGGMGGQWNNPFIYLVWMMFAQRMWGNGFGENGMGGQNPQIASLQNQMQDNHNSDLIMQGLRGNEGAIRELATNMNCSFETLKSCCCDVRCGIDKLGGQIGFSAERIINAVNAGDCNVIQALKDCCCNTQKELLRMQGAQQLQICEQTNTLSNGQRDLGNAIDRGFAASSFEHQRQTCELIKNQDANTQRIIDTMRGHWQSETENKLQKAELELSQFKQNQYIAGLIKDASGK